MSERKSYNVGVWKIPYEERDIAHSILTDEHGFFDVINADDDDSIPVGARCTYRVELNDEEVKQFRTASNLRYIELDGVSIAHYGTGDTQIPDDAVLEFMGALDLSEEWHGRDALIAIVDSGTTQAVRDYMGWNLEGRKVFGPVDPGDDTTTNHGCFTSSNGVPAGGRILDLIVADTDGVATSSAAVAAMTWAADRGCKIISYSYGAAIGAESSIWDDGIRYLLERDVQLFCSTGNDNDYGMCVPANYSRIYSNVHSMGGVNHVTGGVYINSNHHPEMSGVAPGVSVKGLRKDGTVTTWTGTSASAPHAAHLCAMGSTGGSFSPKQVGEALDRNTRDIGLPDENQGHGAYDLGLAMADLLSTSALADSSVEDREWRIISGPEDVDTVIGDTITLEWTPVEEGDYVIRYTAENDAGTGTDEFSVHVDPAPIPIIDLGSPGSVLQYSAFSRAAVETGGGDIFFREWVIDSGPADVGTVLDSDATLNWTPTVSGTYVIRYNAENPRGVGTATLTVTVDTLPVPIPSAGLDVTDLLNRTEFERTGSEIALNVSARSWKILTGPTGNNVPLTATALVEWTPDVPGDYVLRYSVTNAAGTGYDDVSITVVPVVIPVSGEATVIPDLDGTAITVSIADNFRLTADITLDYEGIHRTVLPGGKASAEAKTDDTLLITVARYKDEGFSSFAGTDSTLLITVARYDNEKAKAEATPEADVLTVKLFDAALATAESVVVKADLRPPYTWMGSATATLTGGLLEIKTLKKKVTLETSAELSLYRRTPFRGYELSAEPLATPRLVALRIYDDEPILTAETGISKVLRVATPFSKRVESFTSAELSAGDRIRIFQGRAEAETSMHPLRRLVVVTGLDETLRMDPSIDGQVFRTLLYRPDDLKGISDAYSTRGALIRMRDLPRAEISAHIFSNEPRLRRTILNGQQILAGSEIRSHRLRVTTGLYGAKITAVTNVIYGSSRTYITTALAIAGRPQDSKIVRSITGLAIGSADAFADLINLGHRENMIAHPSIAGDLVAIKLLSEELTGVTSTPSDAHKIGYLSSVIAILDGNGNVIRGELPPDWEDDDDPFMLSYEAPQPVVFARTFHQMRV